MLFAAIASVNVGIPQGELTQQEYAMEEKEMLPDLDIVKDNLRTLAAVLDSESQPTSDTLGMFWLASKSSTQRIASRRIRYPMYVKALTEKDRRRRSAKIRGVPRSVSGRAQSSR